MSSDRTESLAAVFCRALDGNSAVATSELESGLLVACERAEAAWPQLRRFRSRLVTRFAQCLDQEDPHSATGAALQQLHLADLYLAAACLDGDPQAIAIFAREYLQPLDAVLLRRGCSRALVDDVKQHLNEQAFASGERPSILVSYRGRGPLKAWVRTAAIRLALRMQKKAARFRPEAEASIEDRVLHRADPELAYLKQTYRQQFKRAFDAALASLNSRQRLLLRYRYGDGLSQIAIAAVFRVHRDTAARWIKAAREQVLRQTRTELTNRLSVARSEYESLMRLIESNLDLTLSAFWKEAQDGAGSDPA